MMTIDSIKADAAHNGHHFFERGAMRFFRSRVCRRVFAPFIGGAFFVTSEAFNASSPRRFTVRYALDGKVDTVGKFQAFADRRAALAYAARCRDMADEFGLKFTGVKFGGGAA